MLPKMNPSTKGRSKIVQSKEYSVISASSNFSDLTISPLHSLSPMMNQLQLSNGLFYKPKTPPLNRDTLLKTSDATSNRKPAAQDLMLHTFMEKSPLYNRSSNSTKTLRKVNLPANLYTDQELSRNVHLLPSSSLVPSKPANFLSGDRLIGDSAGIPGIYTVFRTAEERAANPDRLNLDRRRLLFCPVLEGEENLRLLNYQHNLISKIENVSVLRRLIFLDLYDNDIHDISNLDSLKSLRVLMLGKNRISKIENLDCLTKLDVLDLHGNQISAIENLNHLTELRVLNLAGNLITRVCTLTGMECLTEINLRRNKITEVNEVDSLPCLQRLYLSFNDIAKFDDVHCIFLCVSLVELALDGNPIAQQQHYKYSIIKGMPILKQLDLKRITDDEKRNALTMARKEEEKKREYSKMTAIKEKRQQAISNAKREWETRQSSGLRQTTKPATPWSGGIQAQHIRTVTSGQSSPTRDSESARSDKSGRRCSSNVSSAASSATPSRRGQSYSPSHCSAISQSSSAASALSSGDTLTFQPNGERGNKIHLAQLDGDTLNLYGCGSLDAFERNWGVQAAGAINAVIFRFMDFDLIIKHLHKLPVRFPGVNSLAFGSTNLDSLQQINALADVQHLDHLTIEPDGNRVTTFSLWRLYTIYRLADHELKTINGTRVTAEEQKMAEQMFSSLVCDIANIPDLVLRSLLNQLQIKSLSVMETSTQEKDRSKTDVSNSKNWKSMLVYKLYDCKKTQEIVDRKATSARLMSDVVAEAIDNEKKCVELQRIWPRTFREIVASIVAEMTDMKTYMKKCDEQFDLD